MTCFSVFVAFSSVLFIPFFERLWEQFHNFQAHTKKFLQIEKLCRHFKHLRFLRIFPFFSDFSPIFLQFSFVSSFEHIIQKRSHLRNENIYRSFSIKNAISCGRCYTRGNQFPFSIHFVPCCAIFSCWKSAAIKLLRSSNLMSACLPTIPNLIHSYSASTHLEETVP